MLAWSVGRNLTGRDFDNVQRLVKEIQHSDPRKGRPLLADVRSNWVDYGQTVNASIRAKTGATAEGLARFAAGKRNPGQGV